ncbi:Cyclotide mech-5 [Zea mays]|uniref:Cyclotide mech-5 n=1 Tax=Zea mays TaxID=4577 RepID=A0A3L6FI71_MAIZE|nr:Cyclotide mech-5 [Zea mays]
MESASKKVAACALALLLLQLMVAPTTATARLLQADTSPVFGLDIIAREFGHPDGAIYCGESCVLIPCISSVIGCRCENKVCVHD